MENPQRGGADTSENLNSGEAAARPGPAALKRVSGVLAYALAVMFTLGTLGLRWWLWNGPHDPPALILYVIPIVISAYLGGLGPGLVSTMLAAAGTNFLVLEPRYSFVIANPTSIVAWITLIVIGVLVSVLTETLHRARQREPAAPVNTTRAIERNVRAGFAIALAVLGMLGALSYYSITHLRENSEAAQRAELAIDELKSLLGNLRDIETSIGRYVITGDATHLALRNDAETAIAGELGHLRKLSVGDAAQITRLDVLEKLIAARMKVADEVIAARRDGFAAGRAAIAGGEGKRLTDAIRALMREIEESEDTVVSARDARAERLAQWTKAAVVLGSTIAFAFVAVALFLIGRDFAGRRHAEATVHRQAQLLDLARDSIFVHDLDNRILYWNLGAQRLYGWAPDEATGKLAHELLRTQSPIPREEIHRQLRESGHWAGELKHTTRDGSTIAVESHWSLRRDEQGEPEAVLEINDDITERKNAEVALHAAYDDVEARVVERTAELARSQELVRMSEQQFAGIVGSAMDGIMTVDDAQRIVLFNAAAEKIFGCPAAAVLGQSLARLLPERYRAAHAGHIEEFGRTGVTSRAMAGVTTIYGLRANGTEFPLEASISQIEVAGRKLYTVVLRDITKRMESNRIQAQLAAIVASSDDAIISKTLDGIITSWNLGAERLFQYQAAEIVDKPITLIIPEDRLHEEDVIIGEIVQGKTVRHYETVRRCKDGTLVDISVTVSPIRDANGAVVGASKIARDIGERRRAEEALRASEERLWLVTDNARVGLVMVNRERRYVYANATYAEILGLPSSDIVDQPVADIMAAVYEEQIRPHLDRAFAGERVVYELCRPAPEQDRFYEVKYEPTMTGSEVLVVVVITDITERKQVEAALQRRTAHLQRLSRQLMTVEEQERRRLGRELHDSTGANLSALLLSLEVFRSKLPPALAQDLRSRIGDCEVLLRETIAQVRDVLADLRPPALDELGLLAALNHYVRLVAQRGDIEIATEGREPSPRLSPNVEIAMFRIAQEALNNATRHAQATRITVALHADAAQVMLIVTDDGKGFDAALLRPGSPSLGLVTMRERAEAMNAQFVIESSPGKGTRIMIIVPYQPAFGQAA